MVKRTCEICGTEFITRPSYVKAGGGRFCSRKCADIHHSQVLKGNCWNDAHIIQTCEICGKRFSVKPSVVKIGHGRFCSGKCNGIWISQTTKEENSYSWKGGLATQTCLMCGIEFPKKPSRIKRGGGKYCSNECRIKSQIGKPLSSQKHHVLKICLVCKTPFSVLPYVDKNGHGKFCSRKCHHIYLRKDRVFMNNNMRYSSDLGNELRKQIRERDNNTCFLCKKVETGRKLSVHHIDYNKENSSPTNLISLCTKCHIHTNKDRDYWLTVFDTLCEFRQGLNTRQ